MNKALYKCRACRNHQWDKDGLTEWTCKKCGQCYKVEMGVKNMDKQMNYIKYYNENQDVYINDGVFEGIVSIARKDNTLISNIGFYEWLFNPKYKTWEVFNFTLQMIIKLGVGEERLIVKGISPVPEIIEYLNKQVK